MLDSQGHLYTTGAPRAVCSFSPALSLVGTLVCVWTRLWRLKTSSTTRVGCGSGAQDKGKFERYESRMRRARR
eukprot:scaffold12710_cov35-Phaeocystis_antarctica.AAC.1